MDLTGTVRGGTDCSVRRRLPKGKPKAEQSRAARLQQHLADIDRSWATSAFKYGKVIGDKEERQLLVDELQNSTPIPPKEKSKGTDNDKPVDNISDLAPDTDDVEMLKQMMRKLLVRHDLGQCIQQISELILEEDMNLEDIILELTSDEAAETFNIESGDLVKFEEFQEDFSVKTESLNSSLHWK